MTIELSRMNWLERVVWIIPFVVIGVAIGGLLMKRWSFTSSLFWRISCFVLAILPMCLAVLTYGVCMLIGYDNGQPEGFRPDSFAFGCFFIASPVYIIAALLLSIFAKGVRAYALGVNICLGIVWYVAVTHVKM
jgi:hypothetical protein